MFLITVLLAATLAPPIESESFKGKLLTVGKNSVTIQVDKETKEIVVSAETKISLAGKPALLKDLKPGDHVKVVAASKSGKLVAFMLAARRAKSELQAHGERRQTVLTPHCS